MTLDVGIHHIDVDQYHADPAPEPSLSSSGITTLIEGTPAHFLARHPRLSPWPIEQTNTPQQTLGAVIHALVLGEGRAIVPLNYRDFKKKEAQEARDRVEAAGQIPILQKRYDQALFVAEELQKNLIREFGHWPIGDSERTVIWKRDTDNGPIYGRALMDHLAIDNTAGLIVDVKTTEKVISDSELERKVCYEGSDVQDYWYTDGIESLYPNLRGRVRFVFAYIEVEPPYSVRPIELPTSWLSLVGQRVDEAANTFAKCLRSNEWPGWPRGTRRLTMPSWREKQFIEYLEAIA